MKFIKVVFTHPIAVPFRDAEGKPLQSWSNSLGSLCTYDNPTTSKIDSLEAQGAWVIARLGNQSFAIPAAKIDCCELEQAAPAKGKAA